MADSFVLRRLVSAWPMYAAFLVVGTHCSGSDHVGSRDCQVISANTEKAWFLEYCERCQDAECSVADCDGLPCLDDRRVAQSCEGDSDCEQFDGALCGKHTAPHSVCTTFPDNQ